METIITEEWQLDTNPQLTLAQTLSTRDRILTILLAGTVTSQ